MVGYFRLLLSFSVKFTLTFMLLSSLRASLGVIFVDECLSLLYLLSAGVSIVVHLALLNLTLSCIMFFIVLINLSATRWRVFE